MYVYKCSKRYYKQCSRRNRTGDFMRLITMEWSVTLGQQCKQGVINFWRNLVSYLHTDVDKMTHYEGCKRYYIVTHDKSSIQIYLIALFYS